MEKIPYTGPPTAREPAPLTPILALKQGSCFSCWKSAAQLKRCTACKRVSYCSQECQKKDWNSSHKKMCKFLVASNKTRTSTSPIGRNWEVFFREKISEIHTFKAKTPVFDKNLERFILYETFCSNCYRRQSQLGGTTQLKNCDTCQLAAFCSDCPQKHSLDECQSFHEIAEDEKWTLEHNRRQKEANKPALTMVCTQRPRDSYFPLSAASGWYEYYTRISDKDLSGLQVTADLRPGSNEPKELAAAGYLRYGTRATTIPLTIVAALERLFSDLGTRTSINLHLVGASPWELERLMVFEEILHLLPSLKNLHLTLVGLDIPKESVSGNVLMLGCCPDCSSQDRTRSVFLFRGPYHDFINTQHYDQPDLAVAFHSGFSQEAREDWMPTIRHLANAQRPTLFTTYNKEEMQEETIIFSQMGAKFVQEGEINQWKTVCPTLEPMGSVENNVFYYNQYCYIISPGNV